MKFDKSEIDLDCRGLACPEPVIRTRRAIEEMDKGDTLRVAVDAEAARDNVCRMSEHLGCKVAVEERAGQFLLSLCKEGATETAAPSPAEMQTCGGASQILLIASRHMGRGADELGTILMRAFLKTLVESPTRLERMFFINSGIHLTTAGSESLETLRDLEGRGTEILSCGTCLDYYGRKDDLAVGRVTNMYDIVEALLTSSRVVTI